MLRCIRFTLRYYNLLWLLMLVSVGFVAGWIYGGEWAVESELRDFWGMYYQVGQ